MLAALAFWGYVVGEGPAWLLGVGAPVLAAVVWGAFVAPKARVPVPASGAGADRAGKPGCPRRRRPGRRSAGGCRGPRGRRARHLAAQRVPGAGRGRRTSAAGRRHAGQPSGQPSVTANSRQAPSTPLSWRALVGQGDAGAGDQVADGPGHQDLAGVGLGQDPGGEVTAMPPTSSPRSSTSPAWSPAWIWTSMSTSWSRRATAQPMARPGRRRRPGVRRPRPFADHLAAPLLDQAAAQVVVDSEQFPPAAVAELGGPFGRGHDVGEQHRGQDPGAGDGLADPRSGTPRCEAEGDLGLLPGQGARRPGRMTSRASGGARPGNARARWGAGRSRGGAAPASAPGPAGAAGGCHLEQGPQEHVDRPGPAIDRCILATQRRNRSSPARLGMAVVTGSAVPRCPRPG